MIKSNITQGVNINYYHKNSAYMCIKFHRLVIQSKSLVRSETSLFINYSINAIKNGNQMLWGPDFDLFVDIRSNIHTYINAGCHTWRVYVTKPLTAAGNLKKLLIPLVSGWVKSCMGAYCKGNGAQVQLQIFQVFPDIFLVVSVIHKCAAYMEEHCKFMFTWII